MSDPRSTFANANVAHLSLRGQVEAPRFVEGTLMRITRPVADLHRAPGQTALERQLVFGEPFHVLETVDAHCFGRAGLSGYVGYVAAADLGLWTDPTHRIAVRATLGFSAPDIKTPDPVTLGLGSRVRVAGSDGRFLRSADGYYIPANHLQPLESPENDPVAVAERLLGTPYLWGGNSAFGVDCSGLVQAGLLACGVPCPGDSDQQQQMLGAPLPENMVPQRGDLLFWKGHVAWVAEAETLLHANAFHMAVAFEPLGAAIDRIREQGDGPVTAHLRPLAGT
ncbi:C40 family peptidase [Arenibacterium sp. CAU 1754]